MEDNPVVKIAFLDVGQGDTIVVSIPETHEAVVIDCVNAYTVLNYLKKENIRHIRGLLITHLHLDHYKGVVDFMENVERELGIDCERILFHNPSLSPSLRKEMLNDADTHSTGDLTVEFQKNNLQNLLRWSKSNNNKQKFNTLAKQPGFLIPLPHILELIYPWEIDIPDLLSRSLNNTSAIIKVKGKNSSALLTGDIEPFGWSKVEKAVLPCDVLKFPHHGAWKDGDINQFLEEINPSLIIISVGTDGSRYKHPNPQVLQAIKNRPNIQLLCTEVTEQCANLKALRSKIKKLFLEQSLTNNIFWSEEEGCSCAGTIIVELGDIVQVLQPNLDFHKSQVIKPNFQTPQCNI